MKIDEHVPDATPTSNAKPKSFSVAPPNSISAAIGINVEKLVTKDRDDGRPRDLLAEGRSDRLAREVVHPELLVEHPLDVRDRRRLELVDADLDDVRPELRILDRLDLRVGVAERRDRVAHLRHGR